MSDASPPSDDANREPLPSEAAGESTPGADATDASSSGAADTGHDSHGNHDHGHHGPEHLAHHFESMEQQEESGKLGMWAFLVTEVLMFGGLFCAYAIYRANHYEVFEYCHFFLDTNLGAINTAVLLASSLTMAIAVRAAQLGQQKLLTTMLALTFLGGCGFMAIKSIEYSDKWSHDLWPGQWNLYYPVDEKNAFIGRQNEARDADDQIELWTDQTRTARVYELENYYFAHKLEKPWFEPHYIPPDLRTDDTDKYYGPEQPPAPPALVTASPAERTAAFADDQTPAQAPVGAPLTPLVDLAGTGSSDIATAGHGPVGVNPAIGAAALESLAPETTFKEHFTWDELPPAEQDRVHLFFQIYYAMTGLHGIHVLVGMGLIGWIGVRSAMGHFGPQHAAPVDIVGLYWHLVDLIWIFLFPLLYLIH